MTAILESTVELRVESRDAIPRLAAWLASAHGVTFMRNTTVRGIDMPSVHTSRGRVQADRVAVCPGDDFNGLYPERLGAYALTRCKLQMLRLADPGFKLPGALMSDLGLGRYLGYADLERWIGTYASAADRPVLIDAPEASVRLAIVTCGAGASSGFAIGEELINSLLDTGVAA